MYKTAIRVAPRRLVSSRPLNASRRFLSTAPPAQKSRSWKNSAARWGIAIAGIYYYNTSNVFAEEPEAAIQRLDESIHAVQESDQPTIDAIVAERRHRQEQAAAEEYRKRRAEEKAALVGEEQDGAPETEEGSDDLEGLEEEAGQQGAFNPETGEINWDCPCLGGMAHGPCGEEFKAAFSCFVYSNEEPKGVECIEKFKGMQDCFRLHPEMYASELEDDEDDVEEELRAREAATSKDPSDESLKPSAKTEAAPSSLEPKDTHLDDSNSASSATAKTGDAEELVPKASHDASSK